MLKKIPLLQNSLFQLNASVVLFGFTGLFGKWLSVHPFVIVFGRVLFASLTLFLLLTLQGRNLRIRSKRDFGGLVLIGVLLALHWLSFFASVQVSNVAICLIALSTAPIIVVLLEPLFFRHEQLARSNIIVAIAVTAGVIIATPSWDISNAVTQGVLWGLMASLTSALITLESRKQVDKYEPLLVSFYQLTTVAVLLLPVMFVMRPTVTMHDVGLLALLGIVFTGVAQMLFMQSLLGVPARLASLVTAGMEVVYGVLLAALLLHEIPSYRTVFGGLIIITATIFAMLQHRVETADLASGPPL
ncbi:EamA family transporter [bacterium]|nr:MAG: EamA family transporter [bacterium]